MIGQKELYDILLKLEISYEYHEHPPLHTIEDARTHWKDYNSARCKNIFFRNHKGNRHYLVIIDHRAELDIHNLEKRLKQGKLTFASEQRIHKLLGLRPGSLSPFGLINDKEKHVHLFIDSHLKEAKLISFHPNINTASLVLSFDNLMKFLNFQKNHFEFIEFY